MLTGLTLASADDALHALAKGRRARPGTGMALDDGAATPNLHTVVISLGCSHHETFVLLLTPATLLSSL